MKTAMSRKDYILIAEALQSAVARGANIDIVKEAIADALVRDNSKFNKAHFLEVVKGGRGLMSRPPRQASKTADLSGDIPDEVLENAELAFWDSVAKSYPTATTGDLGPDVVVPLKEQMHYAIRAWVYYNVPGAGEPEGTVPDATGHSASKRRLAGAKLGGQITPELIQQAKDLIDADDEVIYDVAANSGQIVGNVKHMSWFQREVAEWLAEEQGLGARTEDAMVDLINQPTVDLPPIPQKR
jgi:hypothetical protein